MTCLAHVNIRTRCLEQSMGFYRDVLDLSPGAAATRPGSDDHIWMSDSHGRPCVHLQRTDEPAGEANCAGLHHIAFDCDDPDAWRRKLDRLGIAHEEREFASAQMLQFNLRDPDGVRIELTFAQDSN
jgi:catechol 2,3-dioxygenase-like lactoylglutathione lyase family enzyme